MNLTKIEKLAKQVLKKSKIYTPNIIFKTKDGFEMMFFKFKNKEELDALLLKARNFIYENNIKEYTTVMSLLSDDENNTESLVIANYKKDMRFKIIWNYFIRNNKKIKFIEREIITHKTSDIEHHTSWNFYLEDVMEEIDIQQ